MEDNNQGVDRNKKIIERLSFILTSLMLGLPTILIVSRYPSKSVAMIVVVIVSLVIISLGYMHYKGTPYKGEKYILIVLFYLLVAIQITHDAQIELMCLIGISSLIAICAMYNDKILMIINLLLGLGVINLAYFTSEVGVLSGVPLYTIIMIQVYFAAINIGLGKLNGVVGNLTKEVQEYGIDAKKKAETIEQLFEQVQTATNSASMISETVKGSMENIDEASNQITVSVEACTNSIIGEKEVVQEINDSLEEINGYLETVINSSDDMLEYSKTTKETIEEGVKKAENLFENMDKVSIAATKTQQVMTELREQMDNVGTIVQTIKRIADQTNLLSFNASIESARVGEHGKGFAVVADNIRILANQSRQATTDISDILIRFEDLIKLVIQNMEIEQESVQESQMSKEVVEKVFDEMEQTVTKTVNQTDLVKAKLDNLNALSMVIQDSMKEINELTTSNSSIMQEIMARIEEQTASISDVNADVITLDTLTTELNEAINKK